MTGGFTKRPLLEPYILESICKIIADTSEGLTGSEIGKILADCQIKDVDNANTKWKRLYNAFAGWQNEYQCSNHILKFIQHALHPSRYIGKTEVYIQRLHEVNKRLSFIGTELLDSGKFRVVNKANTLSEAQQRAGAFLYRLENRNIHPAVLDYCKAELLVDNYFHSVFEAVKSIADRLRQMTGVHTDGNLLADVVFSTANPLIRINLISNDTERSEHIGLCNLIKGLFGLIRNPTAHVPKIRFAINEEEPLDIMTTVSMVHKRLDKAL
jgi:uncharacterized protein (TIGR02391 family)